MKALISVALGFVALAGCLAGKSLDDIGIACTADTECPQNAWCDLRYNDNVCRSLDHSSPPHIVFDGFVVGQNQLAQTISVPVKTVSIHSMRLHNDGHSQTYVTLKVDGPACVDAGSLVRSDGELVDEGSTLDADFDVYPSVGCASPATLTFTATASSRTFTTMATISITP